MGHAVGTIVFMVHKFAGNKGYLTKEDLKVFMEKEFPEFLENQKDPLSVDKIMKLPGPVLRLQSGLPELPFTSCWAPQHRR